MGNSGGCQTCRTSACQSKIRRMCAKGVSLDAVGGAEGTRWDGFGMARDEEEGEDDQEEGQEEGRRCWRRKA